MIRDLIDIANKEDEQVAFIFIDQEKAFDRVNHDFFIPNNEGIWNRKGVYALDRNNIW